MEKIKLGHKIAKIEGCDLDSLSIKIRFTDKTGGWISLKHLFEKPKGLTSEILRGNMFEKCFVESGALAWPNGFELCPDSLKQWQLSQHPVVHRKKAA